MTEDEFRELSECLFSEYLLPTERSEVVARLREHQASGHAVVLVSAQFSPSLEVLAGHYNAYGFVGTKIEIKNGLYTGRIIPPVITGADKDRYAREHLLSKGMEVDWEASYAYVDSITDTGLLNMAGHPVAVHPDAKLFDLAKSRKWEMIGDRKPEG